MRAFDLGRWALIAGFTMQIPLGYSVAFAWRTPLWAWHRQGVARALWGTADLPPDAVPLADQLCAMLGATMACWGLAMAIVAWLPLGRGERWAWWCIAASTAAWALVDTPLSVLHGVWVNVGFNATALAMIGLPLALTWGGTRPPG